MRFVSHLKKDVSSNRWVLVRHFSAVCLMLILLFTAFRLPTSFLFTFESSVNFFA
jgi:hypothetical protein